MIFLNNLFGGGGGSGEQGQPIDYVNGTLTVTLPKTEYIHGDTFNTSGAVVKYTSPAGEVTDVTSAASFDPSNGSSLTIDGQNTVRVSYTPEGKDTVYATQIITVAATPQSLTVVLKDTGLRINEAISYKGAKVVALMSDRTEKDVSGATLVWSPLEGTVQDRAGSVNVKCSYTENGVTAEGSAEMNVTSKTLTGLQLNLGTTQYYYNEQFDIATTEVTATYDDGSTASVKSKCEWLPDVRTKFTDHGDQTIYCSYTENSVTKKVSGKVNVKPIPVELTVTLSDYGFQQGEVINYANKGIKVMATWSDNTTSDVTDKCSFDPPDGTTLTDAGRITIKARYRTYHWDITSSTNGSTPDQGGSGGSGSGGSASGHVTKAKVVGIGCDFPNKDYKAGDQLNLEGAHVTALYDDGTTADVTGGANWSPSDGSTLKVTDTKVTCSYSENGGRATQTIQINVKDVPDKLSAQMSVTDYEVGDKLDTSGSQVVVTYSSGREKSLGVKDVTWKPANGTELKREGTQFISVTYTEDGVEVVDRISVRVSEKKEDDPEKEKENKATRDRSIGSGLAKSLGNSIGGGSDETGPTISDEDAEAVGSKVTDTYTDEDGRTWANTVQVAAAAKELGDRGSLPDYNTYRYGNVAAIRIRDLPRSTYAMFTEGLEQPGMYGPLGTYEGYSLAYATESGVDEQVRAGWIHNIHDGSYSLITGNGTYHSLIQIFPTSSHTSDGAWTGWGGGGGVTTPDGSSIPVTDVGETLLSLPAYGDEHVEEHSGSKVDTTQSEEEIAKEIENKASVNGNVVTYNGKRYVVVTDSYGHAVNFLEA